jgi:choline dehydrogenase
MLATSPSVAYGFWKSRDDLEYPDLQLLVTPGSYVGSVPGLLDTFSGMTIGFYQQRPVSTGYVRARSADPFEFPAIQPNYLAEETDRRVVIDAMKLMRKLMRMPELASYIEREEAPGETVQSDDALLDFARHNGSTAFHLISTCRMGPRTDATAVVDDQLRVHGTQALRIVDASIMPNMPSANTGASTMMIAEKGADLILGHPPLPAAVLDEAAA